MLGKRAGPMIGKLSELLVSGGGRADTTGSPRGPLPLDMMKAQQQPSPRALKGYDVGGVGLGIVVTLDKPCPQGGHEVLPKHAVCVPKLNGSGPIPVLSTRNPDGFEDIEVGSLEDYTYVTCRVPNKSFTKVYYDVGQGDVPRQGYKCNHNNNNNVGVLRRATQPALVEPDPDDEPSYSFPTSNFLSSCHLCSKKLHGKDIYMYRGEKAFCSTECRSSQIMMDERKERCRSEASRSVELSSSPYTTREQIFSTGILAL